MKVRGNDYSSYFCLVVEGKPGCRVPPVHQLCCLAVSHSDGVGRSPPGNSVTPRGVLQLNSVLTPSARSQRPIPQGAAQSHETAPLFRRHSQLAGSGLPTTSVRLGSRWHSREPLLGFGNLLEQLTELRGTLAPFVRRSRREGFDEGHRRTADGEVQGVCGEGPAHRSFCPCGLGARHPPGTRTCSPTDKFPGAHTSGIFMEVLSHRRDQLLTGSPSPSPSLENGEQG